jgi:hypothetical protein
MVKFRLKLSILCVFKCAAVMMCYILFACSSTNSKPLLVSFSADSSSIVFSNVDPAGLLHLNDIKASDSVLNDLIAVLQTPSESDSVIKESLIPGHLTLTDTNIVFTPNIPFVKGRDYLVITYINTKFGTAEQAIKSELRTGVRPNQITLTR